MKEVMWRKAGLVRNREQLDSSREELAEIREALGGVHCGKDREYNLA